MTQDEIIKMLRASCDKDRVDPEQNGFWVIVTEELERFAKLVAQHTLSNIDPSKFMSYQEGMEAGRLAEREACAKVCDNRVTAYQYATDVWAQEHIDEARHLAKAIRARGQA